MMRGRTGFVVTLALIVVAAGWLFVRSAPKEADGDRAARPARVDAPGAGGEPGAEWGDLSPTVLRVINDLVTTETTRAPRVRATIAMTTNRDGPPPGMIVRSESFWLPLDQLSTDIELTRRYFGLVEIFFDVDEETVGLTGLKPGRWRTSWSSRDPVTGLEAFRPERSRRRPSYRGRRANQARMTTTQEEGKDVVSVRLSQFSSWRPPIAP